MDRIAPVTNALVMRLHDAPAKAAEKVKPGARLEARQLQAGVVALFEALGEVGMVSARFEKERNEMLAVLVDLEHWLDKAIKSDQLEIKGTDIGAAGTQDRLNRIRQIIKAMNRADGGNERKP